MMSRGGVVMDNESFIPISDFRIGTDEDYNRMREQLQEVFKHGIRVHGFNLPVLPVGDCHGGEQ